MVSATYMTLDCARNLYVEYHHGHETDRKPMERAVSVIGSAMFTVVGLAVIYKVLADAYEQ